MFAANSDVFAPGDSFGIRTTTQDQKVPHQTYKVNPQNVAVGLAGLLVLAYLAHQFTRKGGRK